MSKLESTKAREVHKRRIDLETCIIWAYFLQSLRIDAKKMLSNKLVLLIGLTLSSMKKLDVILNSHFIADVSAEFVISGHPLHPSLKE